MTLDVLCSYLCSRYLDTEDIVAVEKTGVSNCNI